ncbi:MAG: 3-deoxy-8-phosphooctulonate synthase [Rickettsiales bacterium]|jgi:2-dehydro-3-deoxyphosphooctonate aldolase (KDO 8-P synthase)|nr:3-deoxy-8-phosphooctulonate synthase [Rickettsiales bacterium]
MKIKHIKVGGGITNEVTVGNDLPFALMSGPCQLQDRDLALKICEKLVKITEKLKIPYIFKASWDKANRNSINGKRGIGFEKGMEIFDEIRKTFKVPVLTDVHNDQQPALVASHVDMLQQPAFLIRQTDLSVAIAKTGKACNLKKAQFQAPQEMKNIIEKYVEVGNDNVLLTERGSSFGYGALVVDTRSYVIMAETGYPVVCDATHAVQNPAANGSSSGGEGRMAPYIARAALSTGLVGGLFVETHPEPLLKGGSDTMNMIPLEYMEELLKQWQELDFVAKRNQSIYEEWKQEGKEI